MIAGQIEDPVRVGRIQHLLARLQDFVDITPHTLASPDFAATLTRAASEQRGTRCLPETAPLCIRAFWPARLPFRMPATLLNRARNAPVVMGRLVMKFGGTSVANIDRIRNVARHVKREVDAGHDVAVVVSAMAGKTNELVEWCREALAMHDAREYDAVVASGEQVTAGLLAIALQAIGIQARSWQGWQIPIRTSDAHASARILEIDGSELINRFRERRKSRWSPASRASPRKRGESPRSAAAVPTPRRWRSRPPSMPTAATSIPTSTASTPPTRGWCRRRGGSTRSPSRTCWNWRRKAPRCCRCARWNSAWCTTCRSSCVPVSTSLRISTRTAPRRAR